MSVAANINAIHEAFDPDGLYDSIQRSLTQIGLGNQFAVYFVQSSGSGCHLAGSRNLTDQELAVYGEELDRRSLDPGMQLNEGGTDFSFCCVNLEFQGKVFGVFLLPAGRNQVQDLIDTDTEDYFRAVGSAIVKMQIIEDYDRGQEVSKVKIEAINRIAGLLKNLDLDQLLARLLQSSLEILNADVGAVVLREEDGKLACRTELGLREEMVLSLRDCEGRLFIESVLQHAEPVLIRDAQNDGRLDLSEIGYRLKSLICLPLSTPTAQLGAIVIVNNIVDFQEDDFEVFSTIGYLASAAIENALLRAVQVKAERVKEQMKLAREIQENMQAKSIPAHAEFDLDGWCMPCDETGGDYFDFIELGPDQFGIVVGDATGHGIAAALTMVAVRASLLSVIRLGFSLTDVFRYVNNRIEADGNTDRFMTLFCGFLDPREKTVSYCSAGHDCPFLYRSSTDQMIELETTGIPIGMIADWQYELRENIALCPGDILVIATDGVSEGFNKDGEAFGKDRFQQIVRESRGLTANQISNRIRNQLLDFINPAPRTDDITVVVVVVR